MAWAVQGRGNRGNSRSVPYHIKTLGSSTCSDKSIAQHRPPSAGAEFVAVLNIRRSTLVCSLVSGLVSPANYPLPVRCVSVDGWTRFEPERVAGPVAGSKGYNERRWIENKTIASVSAELCECEVAQMAQLSTSFLVESRSHRRRGAKASPAL